ncbi:hypothetical protein CHS0354_028488 [Potamilus streckersoni]|uniref:HEPN domain-containing protein n=1 Tax=Potamilus streckersoni TaxID=2493646 RepID=A0AAE0S7G2_9BIVA|nr:hypothetical protein CHS0354_028488 [Potamilus streckersoni]
MADTDSDSDIEEYSSMEQPPLIKQLKTILAEYPDDGQIIKELLQNAEDAGANEVSFLYDDRCINTQEDNKNKYRKFLRGPALCFFNDATFTESDWRGIKMIYSSVKEEDPLKVGRFGLGFKSVFHMTDHPVVLSGDRIMFMDPHRNPDCVCLTIQLSKLQKWKKFNIEDLFVALDGTFGVSREILKTRFYNGTLFWFPLRSYASKLSDTVYNRGKVMDLFTAFRTEASSILVFLKYLTKVSLNERKSHTNTINMQFTVEIANNVNKVRESRETFLTKIRNLKKSISQTSIDCIYHLSICTKAFDGDRVVEKINNDWKVIHYYKGGSMSEELRALIQDDSLGYRPLVGVATPMGQNRAEFKGHVYCFLPLPHKTKSLTGLPVHVNGFFALSQNRRHIKWPSAEQDAMHLHRDKSLMWNEKLLTEVLPDAYEICISELIEHSVKNGNSDSIVQCVYAAIPRVDQVVDEWNALLPSLFGKIISRPTLMTMNMSGKKSWISGSEAFFATFSQYTNLPPKVKSILVKLLQLYEKQYVDVPSHVFGSYSKFNSRLTDMSPYSFGTMLKENPMYKSLSREEKLIILEFLTLDVHYEILEGLELLPLQDGSFITFLSRRNASEQVLLCSKGEMELFPGLEKNCVYQARENQWLEKHMQAIAKQGLFQMQFMDVTAFQELLEKVIQEHLGHTCTPTVRPSSMLTGSWIQKVWEYICSHKYDVGYFQHMPLIPSLKMGSWSNIKEMELYKLTDFLIVKQIQNVPSLHEGVYKCLELLSIKVLPSLPEWLQRPHILQYIHYSTVNGVMQLFDKLYLSTLKETLIYDFNRLGQEEAKNKLVCFLVGFTSWTSNSKKFVRCLKLFNENGSASRSVSIQENTRVTRVANFPVKYPRSLITGSSDECRLAFALGAKELDRKSLIIETLQMMQSTAYSFSETQIFMKYFIQNIRDFQDDQNILNMASAVPFLESNIMHYVCTPSDLFDPLDSRLRDLFYGENRFPLENCFQTKADIDALKKLNLKTYRDLSAIELYDVARFIESWCNNKDERHLIRKKANRFFEALKENPAILKANTHGHTLTVHLMDMKCMLHETTKARHFPSVLPWFQQQHMLSKPSELRLIKFSTLVGSTMPLIDCQSKELSEAFGWNQDPPQDKVVEQLKVLINVYESSYKPELLTITKNIYQELNKYSILDLTDDETFQTLLRNGCVWSGDGFSCPQDIFLESKGNDLDLSPYLYKLPEEFKGMHSFFLGLGCNKEQNVDVFLKTQVIIKEKYASGKHDYHDVKRDLSILTNILNRLRQEKNKLQNRLHEVLFPIHCRDESTLVLKPGPECTYCDAQWLRDISSEDTDEENIYYVHEDLSSRTAEELGVKSLTQQLLDAEELVMEEWGQEEPLTTRLHRLLNEGYQDGFSVPKEIIQNADDAGAKCVYFLYDERQNEDAKVNLLDEGMAECQGPALWAYNDAHFQTEDFRNITKLNAATKKDELGKIGKFGLGFCSVYNLTDVPSFISGSNIVIFDPHKSHLGKALPGSSPGMKIDFARMKNLRLLKRLKNQFKPFQNVFKCNVSYNFKGTLFRFPLRTASQAQKSEICDKYYSKKECLELLHMTIKAAGNLLLFTQHIQEIKIFHLPESCKNPEEARVIFSMTKEDCLGQSQDINEENILSQVSKLKSTGDLGAVPLKRLHKIIIKENFDQYAESIFPSLKKETSVSINVSWLIAWATGTNETLSEKFQGVVGALPLGAVAVPFEMRDNLLYPVPLKDLPFGFYKSGHLFCFLPLPVSCGLQVHINGCFAVTSDRRQLMTSTEDDKKVKCSSWNTALIQDALVNAYIYLLEGIRESGPPREYQYWSLWPLECQAAEIPITKHFLKKLLQPESMLFHRDLQWQSFEKCVFLDPALLNDCSIGKTAFETFLTFNARDNYVVMELPDQVRKPFEAYYPKEFKDRIISREQFFVDVFLPNIGKDFWSQSQRNIQMRDKLVIYALRLEDQAVKAALSNTGCIPSEPNGILKRPAELVNPLSNLSDMFSDDDEVFPRRINAFLDRNIIQILIGLGMIENNLPFKFLEDRCQSVVKLAQTCGQCAIKRCSKILKYLGGHTIKDKLDQNQAELEKLSHMQFLPVLQKPSGWNFSWKGSTEEDIIPKKCNIHHPSKSVKLDSAVNLFRQGTEKLVGCVELVLDESEEIVRHLDVCKVLKLKGSKKNDVPYETVVRQLKIISQEYKRMPSKDSNICCKDSMVEIYSFLDRLCDKSDEFGSACSKDLSKEEVILLDDQLIDASKVAFNLNYKCSPVLFSLGNTELAKHKNFFKAIGIKEHFDIHDIVTVLRDKKKQWEINPLSIVEVKLINELLSALKDSMEHKCIQYNDLDESLRTDIVAPDTDKVLRETSSLCLDDSEYEISADTRTVHTSISPQLALALGVKTKRKKCFDALSCLIPGGQKENLVNRIKGILSAYPCDDGIMKELLQNADDAQASEIHFIKDYRTHGYEKVFDDKYAPLQGPALCVFNNSTFTQADIEGIHDLGLGSKRGDPLKTGQYGVGFNAVYHLTDAPSFLTMNRELEQGETLCIFDPTCQYLPNVTEQNPGVRCIVSNVRKNYPDVLTGYLERELLQSKVGTVFRFPLRNIKAALTAGLSSEQVGKDELNVILNKFCDDSFDSLLFLKYVSKITVSDISSGLLTEQYRVETIISDEDKKRRDAFFQHVKKASTQYKQDRKSILSLPSSEVGYQMTVLDNMGRSKLFYIVQRFGFMEGYVTPQTILHALESDKIGHLPMGGVAIFIPDWEELMKEPAKQNDTSGITDNKPATESIAKTGRAFCFLPLPLRTGLPCHINGHFVLDHEARRSLWKEDKGYRHDWNHYLFECIVSPSYVSALQFLKHTLFDCERNNSFYIVRRLLEWFFSYFPVMSVANDDDWKAIVKYVYHVLNSKEVPVFPVLLEREVLDPHNTIFTVPKLEWTSLKRTGYAFPAYFPHRLDRQLCHVLKFLGMKVIDISSKIKKSMEESSIPPELVSPVTVLNFLKSYNTSDAGICNLKVDLPVIETTFRSIDNVRSIIEYIADADDLENEIDRTPLLVTSDGVLRTFSSKNSIIRSMFSDLLPSSAERFLHNELYSVCHSDKFEKSRVLVNLSIETFTDLLPLTLLPDIFRVERDVLCLKSSSQIPNESWIVRLWHFVHNMSLERTHSVAKNSNLEGHKLPAEISHLLSVFQHTPTTFNKVTLEKNVKRLNQWSLLPVRHDDKYTLLLPLTKMFTVVDILSFDSTSNLGIALKNMNLPILDTRIFNGSENTFVWMMIRTLVASKTKPLELLTCLCYHKENIRSTQLTIVQCNSVLEYFARRVTDLKQVAEDWWIRESIKALPLHITQQKTQTSLTGNEEVLILPTGMPIVGIDKWALNTGHILLGENLELDELYKLLGCAKSSILDVYCTKILPNFHALPKEYHVAHLAYMYENLLETSYHNQTFNENQNRLINVLKSTAFISTDFGIKCASELYDPSNNVFAQMCDKSDFPPQPFDDSYWSDFLKLIGLKTKVTENMFVEFVEKVAREGRSLVTEDVMQKSDILIQHLLQSDTSAWRMPTLQRLSKAKFIPPYCVSEELLLLHKEHSISTRLICFLKSIPCQYESLCWTSMHMLPEWASLESEKMRKLLSNLGVYLNPPVEKVVRHCQNICDAQSLSFSGKNKYLPNVSLLQSVLDSVYDYLSKHKDEDNKMKEKLHHTPLVFIPESCILLPSRNIVIDLREEDAVEPYLYKAPSYYGRYYDLFIFLGAEKRVTCNHYFLILEKIYQQQKEPNRKLLPPEQRIVAKAIMNLVKLLTSIPDADRDLNVGTLYLPNRKLVLKNARELIVSDCKSIESRLSECRLEFFIGFVELDLEVRNPRPVIKALPDICRPKLLSEIVQEHVDRTEMIVLDSHHAICIENFLHSNEFLYGILRLIKHEKYEDHKSFKGDSEDKICECMQNIMIRKVSGLNTYLVLGGEIIQSSKAKAKCFTQYETTENKDHCIMYFQVDDRMDLTLYQTFTTVEFDIIDLITECLKRTTGTMVTNTRALFEMLKCFSGQGSIEETLDRFLIDPYDSPQKHFCTIFPRPGTYVPKEFHAFLEQGFSLFHRYEYDCLAYELEDYNDDSDSDESVYIYVRIINPVKAEHSETGIKAQYEIDIGDPERRFIKVYAYKLFKFERKLVSDSQDLVLSDSIPVGSLPLDHNCRQILEILKEAWTLPREERRRILRRILLRWHPDKNIGLEDYCSRMFNYIQNVVSQLDSGQLSDTENTNLTTCQGMGVFTGTEYENLGKRVNTRCSQYREQHEQHENAYYEAHRGRSSGTTFPVPDQSNALRWIKQAKKDLSSAKTFLSLAVEVPAFNWICYHCHQATEKAIKASVYATDANKVDLKSHRLASIASRGALSNDIVSLAMDLEECLGDHTMMRYPDSISRMQIPAELFTDAQAITALKIAERVIQTAEDNYLN